MSVLVVAGVAVLAFFYIRMTRSARQKWLKQLDLPGRWRLMQPGEGETEELWLQGALDRGDFVWQVQPNQIDNEADAGTGESRPVRYEGRWRLVGHHLELSRSGKALEVWDLHLFQPGQIGLEDKQGVRRIFSKSVDNVVPLRKRG